MKRIFLNIGRGAFAVLVLILISNPSSSQTLQAGAGLGYVSPSGDFGGTTIDHYAGTKYGFGGGFNVHAKARVNILILNFTAEAAYISVSNSGDAEPGQGKVEISQKILSIKVGPEYRLSLPAVPFTPYLGANVAFNSFSGEFQNNGVSKLSSGTFSVNPATRIGAGVSAGVIFSMNPLMSLDLNLSYNLMNLAGRAWEDADPTKDQRQDSYTSLNDEKDPLPLNANEHFIGNARSINTIQLNASILFGL